MNQEEITAYLAASHIAVVATMNRHGHPHLTPNWYRYDGKVLTLITRTDRLKYLNLQRDNHIAVCIYDPPVASNYVVISGTATCNDRDIWDIAAVAAFYNMSNRLAAATDMKPNREYHYMVREQTDAETPARAAAHRAPPSAARLAEQPSARRRRPRAE